MRIIKTFSLIFYFQVEHDEEKLQDYVDIPEYYEVIQFLIKLFHNLFCLGGQKPGRGTHNK